MNIKKHLIVILLGLLFWIGAWGALAICQNLLIFAICIIIGTEIWIMAPLIFEDHDAKGRSSRLYIGVALLAGLIVQCILYFGFGIA